MENQDSSLETNEIELSETIMDGEASIITESHETEGSPPVHGFGKDQLISQYRAVLHAQAIYYPVAYQFLTELGRGRQGTVFLGLRQGARGCITRHAIKVYDPSIYPSAKRYWTDMGRIASQISKLQSVHDPNLVSRESYDEVNGIGYVQMEVIDGINLRNFLNGEHVEQVRKKSTPEEWARFTDVIFKEQDGTIAIQPGVAVYILRGVLRGLETLHSHGFVHCDVKPSNVMLSRNGYVKVIDYGRAVMIDENVSSLLGTPNYMAPEMHQRIASRAESDLFSVGMVGIEMLRGEPVIPPHLKNEQELYEFKMNLADQLHELLPEYVQQNEKLMAMFRLFVHPDIEQRHKTIGEAESGEHGLAEVHRQLVRLGIDAEYHRELSLYLSKLVDQRINRIDKSVKNG